jgi:hypothetical protein
MSISSDQRPSWSDIEVVLGDFLRLHRMSPAEIALIQKGTDKNRILFRPAITPDDLLDVVQAEGVAAAN